MLACAALAPALFGGDAKSPLLAPDFLDFAKPSDDPYVINGDRLMHDRTNDVAYAVGNAVVSRGGEVLCADAVRVTMSNRMAYAEGNVSVSRGVDVLKCDRLRMDMASNIAWAVGNVELARSNDVWKGEALTYDFKTHHASIDAFQGESPPFMVWAPSAEQRGSNILVLHNAILSTCTNTKDHLHFYIKANTLTVTQGESLKISGATWYLGSIPVLYLPGWYRDMNSRIGFRIRPGYASRWGGFLLTSYILRPASWLESETHLDYRTRRGIAGGQDFSWRSEDSGVKGLFSVYYANDRDPIDEEDDPVKDSLENQRYRWRLTHQWDISTSDQFMLNLDYLSDTDVVEDFFVSGRASRREYLPENYAAIVRRDDAYSAGILYRRRLNDFYSLVDRKPEISLSVYRTAIGGSGFYYESDSAASLLEQTVAETAKGDPYESARVDSNNRLYYPLRPFNGLSLVPRVGYRMTYYSETPPPEDDAEPGATGGGVLRRIPEYGMEASLRISRVWPDAERPYRHVVEPYADYTRVLEPSVGPDELYQFDDIDGLNLTNNVKIGVRNTLQTKRDDVPCTLADVNLYTVINLDREPEQPAIDIYRIECEVTPYDPLRFEMDLDYSRVQHTVESVDARLSYDAKSLWLLKTGYIVRRDKYKLLSVDTGVRFGDGWRAVVFARYEFDARQMQEEGILFRRSLDCLTFDFEVTRIPAYTLDNGRERPDEWTVSLSLVIAAFPDLTLGGHAGR